MNGSQAGENPLPTNLCWIAAIATGSGVLAITNSSNGTPSLRACALKISQHSLSEHSATSLAHPGIVLTSPLPSARGRTLVAIVEQRAPLPHGDRSRGTHRSIATFLLWCG